MVRGVAWLSLYNAAPARAAATHSTIPPALVSKVRLIENRPGMAMSPRLGSRTPEIHTASPAHTAAFGPAP